MGSIRVNNRSMMIVLCLGVLVIFAIAYNRVVGERQAFKRDGRLSWYEYRRGLQYEGSGERIKRLFEKAQRGESITISVIGGSVSKGRGLVPAQSLSSRDDIPMIDMPINSSFTMNPRAGTKSGAPTLYSPENMHVLVFEWFKSAFPWGEHKFVNGAQGAVGAEYFGWCFKEHISEDADLVIIELGINDILSTSVFSAYERLIRSVLEMKKRPAVINIETFTVLLSPMISAAAAHHDICAYYDVPSISLRDVLLPRILANPEVEIPHWFRTGEGIGLIDPKVREYGGVAVDMMHISAAGHAVAADLIIQYLEHQLRGIKHRGPLSRWRNSEDVTSVPSTFLTGAYDPSNPIPISSPVCRSMNSPHVHSRISQEEAEDMHDDAGMIDTGGSRGIVQADGSDGWTPWDWKEKHYLIAKTPGSILKFEFITSQPNYPPSPRLPDDRGNNRFNTRPDRSKHKDKYPRDMILHDTEKKIIGRGGSLAISYQRSKYFGLGCISCWVDDKVGTAKVVDGYWDIGERNMGVVMEIANDLAPGPHTLQCELMAETNDPKERTEFRIIAIMHD